MRGLRSPTAELSHSDVLVEDPSPEFSSFHWDAWLQSGRDPLESKDTADAAVTPATSEKQEVLHLELVPPKSTAQVGAVAIDPVVSPQELELPDLVTNNDVLLEAVKRPPKYVRFEDSSDLQQQLSEQPEGPAVKKRKPKAPLLTCRTNVAGLGNAAQNRVDIHRRDRLPGAHLLDRLVVATCHLRRYTSRLPSAWFSKRNSARNARNCRI